MEFGIIIVPQVRDGKSEPFDDVMEQITYAEELGYDTVWLTEHHFSPYGRAAVPALAGYAIARTSKIRVSTAVVVTPFHHPIQVAEDWATLDHLSHGRVDVGIANAGFGRTTDALKLGLDEFHQLLATNLDGVFLVFRELGRHMSGREGGGKLVAISSLSAESGTPLQPHYAASKGGVESLVRAYAVKLARHDVQVNAIRPGWIVTEATALAVNNEEFSKLVVKRIPARRWGTAEDLGGIAVYLASDASRYHTGDVIRVDGGYAIF